MFMPLLIRRTLLVRGDVAAAARGEDGMRRGRKVTDGMLGVRSVRAVMRVVY
jgi:hypothetical protein